MQHLEASAQVAIKQRVLEDNLWHLGKVKSETLLRPIEGPTWGYRYRARLSVRYVIKKGEVLIGFHERKSRYIADMKVCPVLPPHVSRMLLPLRALIGQMEARETLPQLELACGDEGHGPGAAPPGALERGGQRPCCGGLLPRIRFNGGCSPKVRTRCICWTRVGRN